MGACEQGVGCPVSKTYTDYQFEVPEGCSSVAMTAQKNAGRGRANSFPPTLATAFRGELEISDEGFGGGKRRHCLIALIALAASLTSKSVAV